jgi:hypothetical protein
VVDAENAKYIWRDYSFYLRCIDCQFEGAMKVEEVPIKSIERVRLIRWNPLYVEVVPTGLSPDDKEYKIKLTRGLRNRITMGDRKTVLNIPQTFIKAAQYKRKVVLTSRKVFHSKRPSASREEDDNLLGVPLILPVLKHLFFMQVLQKAQEAVAMEHIVPLRVLFPQVRGDADNIYAKINLDKWQQEAVDQVKRWKRDINHIPVMSVPMGVTHVGGQGKGLLLYQEIRLLAEQIIAGMGVPVSFFFGEAQYSGASVNLKALENEFSSNRDDMLELVKFIFTQICMFLNIPLPDLTFRPFRMADDLQRAAYDMQLSQIGKLSDQSLLEKHGHSYEQEQLRMNSEEKLNNERMLRQQKAQAEAQGQATVIATRYQVEAQMMQQQMTGQPQQQEGAPPQEGQEQMPQEGQEQMPQEGAPQQEGQEQMPQEAMASQSQLNPNGMPTEGQPGGEAPYVDVLSQAKGWADEIGQQPHAEQMRILTMLRRDNPELSDLVQNALNQRKAGGSQNPLPSSNYAGNPTAQQR